MKGKTLAAIALGHLEGMQKVASMIGGLESLDWRPMRKEGRSWRQYGEPRSALDAITEQLEAARLAIESGDWPTATNEIWGAGITFGQASAYVNAAMKKYNFHKVAETWCEMNRIIQGGATLTVASELYARAPDRIMTPKTARNHYKTAVEKCYLPAGDSKGRKKEDRPPTRV